MKKFVDDAEKEYEESLKKRQESAKIKENAVVADSAAVEASETDVQPIIDFSKTEDTSFDYVQRGKEVKAFLKNQMEMRLLEFFIGILFIVLTTKTGVLGSILFMAAIFYLIPDGLLKSIIYIYRYRHYENYIESNDYRVTGGYISIVMSAIRKKGVFNAGRSENND